MIDVLQLHDRIILTGKVPYEEIQAYYSIIDIHIYPRKSERITELTTPLKPLEAMAMRKNVIISDVGGLKELVPDGCGAVFKAGNISDLKTQVKRLIVNTDLRNRMVQSAYAFAQTRDWDQVVQRYKKIYRTIS